MYMFRNWIFFSESDHFDRIYSSFHQLFISRAFSHFNYLKLKDYTSGQKAKVYYFHNIYLKFKEGDSETQTFLESYNFNYQIEY